MRGALCGYKHDASDPVCSTISTNYSRRASPTIFLDDASMCNPAAVSHSRKLIVERLSKCAVTSTYSPEFAAQYLNQGSTPAQVVIGCERVRKQ